MWEIILAYLRVRHQNASRKPKKKRLEKIVLQILKPFLFHGKQKKPTTKKSNSRLLENVLKTFIDAQREENPKTTNRKY